MLKKRTFLAFSCLSAIVIFIFIMALFFSRGVPDIAVKEISLSPESPDRAERFSVSVTITNIGSASSVPVLAELLLDGKTFSTFSVPSILPSADVSFVGTTIPANIYLPGKHLISVHVNPLAVGNELSFENNVKSKPFIVTAS